MDTTSLNRTLAVISALATLTVACMVIGILGTGGVSQDFFEGARTAERMVRRAHETHVSYGLRLNLGLDNIFIVLYGSFFVFLGVRMRGVLDPWVAVVATVALLLTAFLDSVENHHLRTMLHSAERGLPLSTEETQLQMTMTQVKFHCSYLGAFLFSIGFWRLGGLARVIAAALWLYVPVGALISVLPLEVSAPFVLGRTCFFIVAFLLSTVLFWQYSRN